MQIKTISSRQNPLVVSVGKLSERKYRDRERLFRFDGFKLFCEALAAGLELTHVIFTPRRRESIVQQIEGLLASGGSFSGELVEASESVFEKLSEEKAPDGVICVSKYIDKLHKIATINNVEPFLLDKEPPARLLLLESVRDAGNVGTILRSAAAFGIDGIVLSADCADIYNPKTIRGAMGALFRLPVFITPDLAASVRALSAAGRRVLATALDRTAVELGAFPLRRDDCFVIGNEGHGISAELLTLCERRVFIPMAPASESLNAAVAASLCMWELSKIK